MTLDPIIWRKSTLSHTNGCVEVAHRHGYVVVRDSKDPDGPTVPFTEGEWRLLLAQAITGRFPWRRLEPLSFDAVERAKFISGARRGEFSIREPAEVTEAGGP